MHKMIAEQHEQQDANNHNNHNNKYHNDNDDDNNNHNDENVEMTKISFNFASEFKFFFKLSWRCCLFMLLRYLNLMITSIMIGQRGNRAEMNVASLANGIIVIFGFSIDAGFSSAVDTMMSQSFGSNNKKLLGDILQRAIIIITMVFVLMACVLLNICPLLIFIGQDPAISSATSQYLAYFLPGLYCDFLFLIFARYLQNQNKMVPPTVSMFCGVLINALMQFLTVFVFKAGINYSAICQAISCFASVFLLVCYIVICKVYVNTWQGFNIKSAMQHWMIFIRLGISGLITVRFNYDIGIILAGLLNHNELIAQTIGIQIYCILGLVSNSLATVCAIRVGQELGARNLVRVKYIIRAAVLVGMSVGTVQLMFSVALRWYLPQIYTSSVIIIKTSSNIFIFISIALFLDGLFQVFRGTLRGCGRQFESGMCNFLCNYVFSVLIGTLLVFKTKLGIKGFWIGLLVGQILNILIFFLLIKFGNWQKYMDQAQVRLAKLAKNQFHNADSENPEFLGEDYDNINNNNNKNSFNRSLSSASSDSGIDRQLAAEPKETGLLKQHTAMMTSYNSIASAMDAVQYRAASSSSSNWRNARLMLMKKVAVLLLFAALLVFALILKFNYSDLMYTGGSGEDDGQLSPNAANFSFISVHNHTATRVQPDRKLRLFTAADSASAVPPIINFN